MTIATNHTAMRKNMIRKMRRKCMNLGFRSLVWLLCFLLLCPPQMVLAADPVPSGATGTTVNPAANGVPVVNIATPNGSGMSHNAFTSYDVDTHGLVLNNGDMSEAFRQSQLAGQIAANPNLATGNQASIILNEVTGNARTTLSGFTEVLGGRADVIIANPFGITSSGGGFINTDRASLVTGTPDMTGGTFNGFNVRGGDILITGTGIDASAQQVLNLVSRKITVEGQVNAQTLNMVAGTNNWNHATGATSAIASDGSPAPTWAIDSSALGGMYAGRINLKATEAGVGVHTLGEAAATADDFIITASGKIEIGSKLSAQRDLSITSTSAGADAVKATDANLSAGRNIGITATNGGATLTGGGIKANGELAYNLGTLTDTSSATAGIADANKRYGDTVNLVGSAAWIIDGVYYGAGSALTLAAQSLSAGTSSQVSLNSGGTMSVTATGGDLAFANAVLKSAGNMNLTSNTGSVTFGAGAGTGVQATAGNINLSAASNLSNAVTITADAGDIIARVDAALNNSGSMHAYNLLDVRGKTTANSNAVYNTGSLWSGSMNVQTGVLGVTGGGTMESTGNMDVTATNTLTIGGVGDTTSRILAATSGAGTGALTFGNAFTNYGALHSGYDLNVAGGSFLNMSTGGISATHDLTARATNGDMVNQGALYAGNDLVVSATNKVLNDSTVAAAMGTIGSGRDMTFTANQFINSSYIDAGRNITVTAPIFKNEVKGGDTRYWLAIGSWDTDVIPNSFSSWERWPDWCYRQGFKSVAYQTQDFAGGDPQFNPHIYGGGSGTVLITGFDSGANTGAIISGHIVTFSGNALSTLTNTDLSLSYREYSYTYDHYWEVWAVHGSGPDPDRLENFSATTYTEHVMPMVRYGSRIKADTLNVVGSNLTNSYSPFTPSPYVRTAAGSTFPGLTLSLPTNPNGMFVTSQNPSAGYLVESNPLYTNVDNYLGSEYLLEKYNFKPDTVIKRLGDAGYETYLVGQQLASQTGGKLLPGYASEKAQMQGLMDNAANQAGELGLTYGQPLSRAAQSMIKEDMVWMVETEVNGQKVLAPVVYLAATTKEMFASGDGASISGQTVNMNLTSLTNTGGTISGAKTLNVTTQGDIKNISGTISGGNVALTSTDGSIVNQTLAQTTGDGRLASTTIGKQAGIVATGDLKLDAAKDIANLGANIAAGGDASLTAGNDVILDTIQNNTVNQTRSGKSVTTVSTTEQIGSTLSTGGNLKINAKNDITVAGSAVSAGGNADLDAGNNINVLARDDSRHEVSSDEKEGFGVGGGLWGTEKTSSDHLQTTAKGSTISSGGSTNLSADKTVLLQGAKLNSGGDINIAATDVKVLEARNVDKTTTHTETTSILSISSGDGGSGSATSTSSADPSGEVAAGAKASASNDLGGLDFKKTTTKDTLDESSTAVASQINAGKGLTITAKKDVLLRGAEVKTGGDANLSGENVNILAAQDTHVATSTTSTTKVGLYLSSTNSADANAEAGATSKANIGSASANAGSTATANAKSNTSIDVVRTNDTTTTTTDITNKGTTLASGGNLKITSKENLVVQGSDLSGETGVDVKAKDMAFLAAEDSHTSTTSTTKTSTGLYIDGTANAKAQTNAAANAGLGVNAGASASANAKAELSIGVQHKNSSTSSAEGTTTARVSSITSGSGSITRTAANSITDVGTAIDAAGDFSQTATTYDSQAAKNTSFKTSSSTSNTAKVGVYAKAQAGVEAEAGANAGLGLDGKPKAEAGAGAKVNATVGAGVKASYNRDASDSSSTSSEAVVSTIKSGGKLSSVTTGKTTLEGTLLSGGTGVALEADSLDFKAAKNTTTDTSSSSNINGSASAGITRGTGKGIEASVSGGTKKTDTSESTSTAVAGGIESNGNISIKTKGDTRLEGTNLAATGDTGIEAGGNIVFDAARDTETSSESSYDASGSLNMGDSAAASGSKAGIAAKASGGYSKDTASSSTATAGSIATGGKLNLSAGKAVTLEGTNMAAGGDATVSGKEGVTFNAARSTSESESTSVRVGVEVGKTQTSNAKETTSSKSVGGTAEVGYSRAKESTAEAGSLVSGGNLVINSGKDVNLEGTGLAAGNKASINAGGAVNFTAAESTSESTAVGVSLSASASKTDKTPKTVPQKTPQKPAAPTPVASKTPAPAAKNPGTGGTQGSDGSAQSTKDLATWQDKQGAAMQELKGRQNPTTQAAAPSTTGSKTPPPVPTAPKPARTTGTPAPTAAKTAGAKTPPPVPTAPKPVRTTVAPATVAPTTTPAANDAVATTEKEKSVAAGFQLQVKNKTVQQAGSITAGAGGIEINAEGGNVNLVGTKLSTSGDANIAAAGDVNITATKNTESGFGVTVAASADKKSEAPTNPAPAGVTTKKTPPPVPTAPKPARTTGTTGTTSAPSTTGTKTPPPVPTAPKPVRTAGATGATSTPSTTGTKTPPPVPTAPKPVRTTGTTGTTSASSTTGTKTPPPVPTAPKPVRTTGATGATSTPSTAGTKTPPPVPTAPKPVRTTGTTGTTSASSATGTKTPPPVPTAPKPARTGISVGTTGIKASVPTTPASSGVWKGEAGTSATTAADPDNTSSAFVGIGGGGSIQNQGATINTGGALNITSGGKTTLVNTDIKAAEGENINAAGGVERKTLTDVKVLNADTNSGPAAVSETVSKVPMSDMSGAPGTPATAVVPQSTLKAAQGGGAGSSPTEKKK